MKLIFEERMRYFGWVRTENARCCKIKSLNFEWVMAVEAKFEGVSNVQLA
jgi:hypothetical protein